MKRFMIRILVIAGVFGAGYVLGDQHGRDSCGANFWNAATQIVHESLNAARSNAQ